MTEQLWSAAAGLVAGLLLTPRLPPVLRALGLERTNYQGSPIGSGAGLLFLLGAVPWLALAPAPALAAAGFGLLGLIDDRWGTSEFKGLRGHFKALLRGRMTTGLLKAAGGAALAAGLAFWSFRDLRAVPAALLIALCANLFNLLDLRPLRALKVFWLLSLPLLAFGPALLWQTGAMTLPYAPLEARRRLMLGDTGANLLGGLLGFSAALALPTVAQAVLAALLIALHGWAERHSLSRWIESRDWARALDRWGWAGPEPASDAEPRPPGR